LFVDLEPTPGAVPLGAQKSPVEALTKLCAANQWGMPSYTREGTGGEFAYAIRIPKLRNVLFEPGEARSEDVDTAKNLAADQVLSVLAAVKR
jgi:hypothetical protein